MAEKRVSKEFDKCIVYCAEREREREEGTRLDA